MSSLVREYFYAGLQRTDRELHLTVQRQSPEAQDHPNQ